MLGKEAVALADAWRPNGIGAEEKARWLSQIDGRLLKELYALYDGEEKEMPLYTPEGEEELLAPAPYDEIYVYGLCARYDFTMGEIERYNMDAMLYGLKLAHEAGAVTILNPAPACRLPEEIYKNLYLIIPNQGETTMLTGIEVKDDKTAILGAKSFWEKGVKRTIITMGSKGSMLYDDGKDMFIPAKKVKAIDTTAAGDTFCGAVCVALAEGKSLKEAAEFATAASSITVQRMGAQDSIPTRKEVPAKTEIRPRAATLARGEMADAL